MIANDDLRNAFASREQIKRSVRMLCDAFARKLNDDALDTWAERLEPYSKNPLMWRVLKDAVAWENWPNLGVLLGKIQAEIKHSEGTRTPPPMSDRERERSDTAAIRSMLWLIYEKGWKVEDFAGHALARAFLRLPIKPPEDETDEDRAAHRAAITRALTAAMQIYDRASIARWMEQSP